MNKAYDCIVIGAGISGLTSAAFLAKKGISVALFERNSQLGGIRKFIPEERIHF